MTPKRSRTSVKTFSYAVVDGEGEHAVQHRQAIRPVLFPEMQDHLGVAAGAEDVAGRPQLVAQLGKIIDFAVVT